MLEPRQAEIKLLAGRQRALIGLGSLERVKFRSMSESKLSLMKGVESACKYLPAFISIMLLLYQYHYCSKITRSFIS